MRAGGQPSPGALSPYPVGVGAGAGGMMQASRLQAQSQPFLPQSHPAWAAASPVVGGGGHCSGLTSAGFRRPQAQHPYQHQHQQQSNQLYKRQQQSPSSYLLQPEYDQAQPGPGQELSQQRVRQQQQQYDLNTQYVRNVRQGSDLQGHVVGGQAAAGSLSRPRSWGPDEFVSEVQQQRFEGRSQAQSRQLFAGYDQLHPLHQQQQQQQSQRSDTYVYDGYYSSRLAQQEPHGDRLEPLSQNYYEDQHSQHSLTGSGGGVGRSKAEQRSGGCGRRQRLELSARVVGTAPRGISSGADTPSARSLGSMGSAVEALSGAGGIGDAQHISNWGGSARDAGGEGGGVCSSEGGFGSWEELPTPFEIPMPLPQRYSTGGSAESLGSHSQGSTSLASSGDWTATAATVAAQGQAPPEQRYSRSKHSSYCGKGLPGMSVLGTEVGGGVLRQSGSGSGSGFGWSEEGWIDRDGNQCAGGDETVMVGSAPGTPDTRRSFATSPILSEQSLWNFGNQ